ncbi:cell division protein FtsI [Microbacterium nanhaiense]|uniref:Cell division protein FtsI n=1 Tax=Microbacterium nanhaiense TaxID=1301026 RepID=A0ABQ2N0G9_9MICO|nr:penicillin-binding transpeptidase domain-containing protein [Microbacterium nanhaiense]GGO63790.1 cell division protein FtsI [Microbacterium nanhaiense]
MTKEIRRLSIIVVCMFLALFVSTSVIQVVQAQSLSADTRNKRTLYDSYDVRRGPIIAGGEQIARSTSTNDTYRFQRVYDDSDVWSGITGWFNPALNSATGIEQSMTQELSNLANSGFLARLNQVVTGQEARGSSIELTLDPEVQRAAYGALTERGYKGAVIASDPKTGRILALVSTPGFDANAVASHDGTAANAAANDYAAAEGDPLRNKAINQLYQPGSTFKLVVAAAALASGDFTADSTFENTATYTPEGTTREIVNAPYGTCGGSSAKTVTLADAIKFSCNVPMAQLAIELGDDAIREQAEKFGFESSFELPLPTVESTIGADLDTGQTARLGFGQNQITTTPLQVHMWTSAIANGGVEMNPLLVDQVVGDDLSVQKKFEPSEYGTPIDADIAKDVTEMMASSVASGAASNARIEDVDVAGKTGTAENGENDPYTLWFTGFAPAEDPDVAVTVMVADGGGQGQSGDGNSIAAPIAKKVMEAVLAQ